MQLFASPKRLIPKENYPDGTQITGSVVNVTNFGVFVEVEPDFNGLLRMDRPELLSEDQNVAVIISGIDIEKQQISLDFPVKTDSIRHIRYNPFACPTQIALK